MTVIFPTATMKTSLSILAGITLANAHGYFQSPKGRLPGDAFKAACGDQAYNMMSSDINGNIQGLKQLTANQADFKADECNLWQCKGMKYSDNTANVETYTPGQEIPLYFQIVAPHSGFANVSVVNTKTNSIVSANLTSWDEYAMTSTPMKAEWQNFTVTMPTELEGCAEAGECVLQMHWDAPEVDQTYQSCIDFTLGGVSANSTKKRRHARDF